MLSIFGGYRSILGKVKQVQLTNEQKRIHDRAVEYANKVCYAEPSEARRQWFALHLRLFKESEDARVEVKTEAAAA